MPNREFCLDAVKDALYVSVADILSAFWQLPVAKGHVDRTAFVTPRGKYCFKRMLFGVANGQWLFQHVISLALAHLDPDSGIRWYMNDFICINHTFESHLVSLEKNVRSVERGRLGTQTVQNSLWAEISRLSRSCHLREGYFRRYRPHQSDSLR